MDKKEAILVSVAVWTQFQVKNAHREWTLVGELPEALHRAASEAISGMDGVPSALALATRIEVLCEERGVELEETP